MRDIDNKMLLFLDKQIFEETISHSLEKGISKNIILEMCDPRKRIIVANMIAEGEWHIAPPYIAEIPKDNGEKRKVYVNQPLDRIILTQINHVYQRLYSHLIHRNCVSYQKGIGVKNIVDNICKAIVDYKSDVVGYKVDISKYFDSVDKSTLNNTLELINTNSPIDRLVSSYYNEDLVINENGELEEKYKSITQGCAVSTFLANIILNNVDEELSKMDIIYYRYSDDILMIGKDSDRALEKLNILLKGKGLCLNPKKIEPINKNSWFTFLGVRINQNKKSLSNKSIKKFQKKIQNTVKESSPGDKKEVIKAIKKINKYLYTDYLKSHKNFGWAEYFFSILNIEEDIRTLDEYIKDALRSIYTGKKKIGGLGISNENKKGIVRGIGKNVTANYRKTKEIEKNNDLLEELGYVSMVHLFKLFCINKELYRTYLFNLI